MHTLMPLALNELHLWLSFYDEIKDERLLSSYRELLSADENERQQRFHFARDKHRYLVTRAMVRTVLSRYAFVDPKAWNFSFNAYGRPEIANADYSSEGLSFNLSHTHGLIVLGVARHRAFGIDVENFVAHKVSIDIANRYFSTAEMMALATVPSYERQYRFFEYWTFKEAYIKARGMGLSLPLDKFSFRFPRDGVVEMTIAPDLKDDPSRWQLCQFRPAPQYVIAVCAERTSSQLCTLSVRRIVPAANEEPLTAAPTRGSLEFASGR